MRSAFWITLAVAAALCAPAHAKTIKAKGAAAAGVCAGALELAAGMTAKAGTTKPAAVLNMQSARDFFAEMPQFDRNEIAQNAQGFIRFMNERATATKTDAERAALSKEVLDIAKRCFESVQQYAVNRNVQSGTAQGGQAVPAQPGVVTTQPMILQPDPLPVQPAQPLPLDTQPLVVNPQ